MISSVLPPIDLVSSKANMFWDGTFHLCAWLVTLVAIAIVVRELARAEEHVRNRVVVGGALAGWGLFNLVEGVIDHELFRVHHVHPGFDEAAWDVAFLVLGGALVALGAAIAFPVLRRAST